MGALFFDQTGGGLEIPNACTDFTVEHNGTDLIATLNWVNPSTAANGNPLSNLLGVYIFRDGNLIADVTDVQIGEPYAYDDDSIPVVGQYEYELIPYNSYGNGVPTDNAAWIGLDTPGIPADLTVTPDPNYNLECTLEWSPPVEGEHGGYWPAGSWDGQVIYRNGEEIANLAGTNISYVDDQVPEEGFYTYEVAYYNTSGQGPALASLPVYVGFPQFEAIPYNWVEIAQIGSNTGISQDDQVVGPFDLPFPFPWWDFSYASQIWICSNGWVSFSNQGYGAYYNVSIPNVIAPNDMICPYWDDLSPNQGGNVFHYYDQVNERYIIEYHNIPHYGSGGNYTFEMIMYPNGDVELMYNSLTPGTLNSATVGFENATGNEGIQVTYNGSGPLNPQPQMGIRIYSVNNGMPDMTVTLTPEFLPIQIPAGGGSFNFDIEIINNGSDPVSFDAWTDATLPSGGVYSILLRTDVMLAPGGSLFRELTQNVPSSAPAGIYSYNAHTGAYPDVVFAEDSFPFEKLETGDSYLNPDNSWNLYGWDGDAPIAELPDKYDLLPPYPNPFNPQTTLNYTLPQNGEVQLVIYDVQGREVIRLVDGWQTAGVYEVKFDASHTASGIYFAMLRVSGKQFTQKLLLVK